MPLLALLVGVAYLPLPSGATAGRWWVMALGVAILLWGARLRPGPGHWAWLALLAWAALSTALWSVSGWDALSGLLQLSTAAGVFVLAAEATQEDNRLAWLALAGAVTVSAPFSILQLAGYAPVLTTSPGAGVGLFLSPNAAGEVATLALVGAIGMRVWWLVPGPLVVALASGGRTPLLALLAAGATALWLLAPRGVPRVMLGVVYAYVLTFAVAARGMGWLGHLGFVDDRIAVWGRVLGGVTLLGGGLGSLGVASTQIEFAHNEFLHYAFELGVGSVFLWGVFWYALGAAPVLERAALAAVLAQCLVWFPLHDPATLFLAALLAGSLCGCRHRQRLAQCACGIPRASCIHSAGHVGAGAPRHADGGGRHVAARQESSLGTRAVRPQLQPTTSGE